MRSAQWADLKSDVVQRIFLKLNLRRKISCDVVCKTWRHLLCLQPSSGTWAQPFVLTDNSECAKLWHAILMPPAASPLPAQKIINMATWFKQRAGVQCIFIGCKHYCLRVNNSNRLSVMYWLLRALAEAEQVPVMKLHWGRAATWSCHCTSNSQCLGLL